MKATLLVCDIVTNIQSASCQYSRRTQEAGGPTNGVEPGGMGRRGRRPERLKHVQLYTPGLMSESGIFHFFSWSFKDGHICQHHRLRTKNYISTEDWQSSGGQPPQSPYHVAHSRPQFSRPYWELSDLSSVHYRHWVSSMLLDQCFECAALLRRGTGSLCGVCSWVRLHLLSGIWVTLNRWAATAQKRKHVSLLLTYTMIHWSDDSQVSARSAVWPSVNATNFIPRQFFLSY